MPTSQRMRRIADLIQRTLAELLKKEVSDPRLRDVTITSADVAPDLSHAKVYFTLVNHAEAATVSLVLNNASGYLRTLLAHALTLRTTPRLIFIFDETLTRAERIQQLLEQADKDHPTEEE